MNNTRLSDRPPIPDPMKREVRQRCGFGCVVCGLPLYTYEHMLGYANVKRHVANELTLLCDLHQRERTNKLLQVEQVIRANKNPYNLRRGISTPYLFHYDGPSCIVDVGTNVFSFQNIRSNTEFVALAIDDDALIGFKFDNSHCLLNITLFDENDNPMLKIVENELTYSVNTWDIEFVGHSLIIREAQREILIDLLFEPPNKIKVQRGYFFHGGIKVEVKQDFMEILNLHGKF